MIKSELEIIIFMMTFPFKKDQFCVPELPHLAALFRSIVIVPKQITGKKQQIPANIAVDPSLAKTLKYYRIIQLPLITLFQIFSSYEFYNEIVKKPRQTLHFDSFIRLIHYFGDAIRTEKWVVDFINHNHINLKKTIFYTYWLDETTMGLCLAKKKFPEMKIISRAHGFDIYNERSTYGYIPFRPEIFENLNKVYTASLDGEHYLSQRNPVYKDIFKVELLGINNPGFVTKQSDDSVFRIVSCSAMVPVKRVELLIHGLKKLGNLQREQNFFWVHIGTGPLETTIKKISKTLPENIEYHFLGQIPNKDVISFYKNNPIDILINVSQSEGGNPVSIMEAQSCGIPVIATAVGGNIEIVNEKVGILLNADPTPEEIANAIINFMKNPELIKERKYYSKINYEENYDADKNFQSFAQELIKLF